MHVSLVFSAETEYGDYRTKGTHFEFESCARSWCLSLFAIKVMGLEDWVCSCDSSRYNEP